MAYGMSPLFARKVVGTFALILILWFVALFVYTSELDSIIQELVTVKTDTSDSESHHDDEQLEILKKSTNESQKYIVFPEENLADWVESSHQFVTYEDFTIVQNDREEQRRIFGMHNYAYNVLVSDKIGPRRPAPDHRHELCRNLTYSSDNLPKASIVIVYHNEALSVLIRMLNSILDLTPPALLHEIILLDDWSEQELIIQPYLEKYAVSNWPDFIKFYRTDKREGLIRAKIQGANLATGQVLVFLDSHCEVTEKWLEPLLTRISQNSTHVVAPIVDIINPHEFNYSNSMVCKGGFDWGLHFRWVYLPWSYFEDLDNNTNPLPSAAISGGLFAIDREYFNHIGQYDPGMDIWGAENIEISIRIWLCGGSLEVIPCSRVGHVFRYTRRYKNPNNTDSDAINTMRVVEVWLDQPYKDKYYERKHWLKGHQFGDVSERLALKQRLGCRNFQWFLDNVYPDLKNE